MRLDAPERQGNDGELPGPGGGGGPIAPRDEKANVAEGMALMRQWLFACLKPYMFVSVQVAAGDGESERQFFQVLSVQTKQLVVECFDDEVEKVIFNASIQPLEFCTPIGTDPFAESAEVFVLHDPRKIDLMKWCQGAGDHRHDWMEWTPAESAFEGCTSLTKGTTMVPRMPLSDKSIPVLALVDALVEKGFCYCNHKVEHTPTSANVYDHRQLPSKRCYLQAVLACEKLWSNGVVSFVSGQPSLYYEVIMKGQNVKPGLGVKSYKKSIAAIEGDALELQMLEDRPADIPRPRKRPLPEPEAMVEVVPDVHDEDIAGDPDAEAPVDEAMPIEGEQKEEIVGDPLDANGGAARSIDRAPKHIDGNLVEYIKVRKCGKWKYSDRISVRCNYHENCERSRSLDLEVASFGDRAAEGFLGAWLRKGAHCSAAEHKRLKPLAHEIWAYLAE